MSNLNDLAVNNFRKYLQIPSVHPNIDYEDCVIFLENYSKELDLPIKVVYVKPDKPVVIITWRGSRPYLPSILLNSHMDVVPVHDECWKHKPFAAEIENGNIYARGSQDMKCVGIQYLEAIRRLMLEGIQCLRNVNVCFVPDEEIGGIDGMKCFVRTQEFKELNVGVCLDEGFASETDQFILLYSERNTWQFTITCKGQSGHGSFLLENTPAEKVAYILDKAYEFRRSQQQILRGNSELNLGNVTTINCTRMSGGIQENVIPSEMKISFDCRVATSFDLEQFECMLNRWCTEAGTECTIEYRQKDPKAVETKLNNENVYWKTIKETTAKIGIELIPIVCPGSTDSRFVRELGIPAFGFSPMNNTKRLLHSHDEYLGIDTFLKGIDIYCKLIKNLSNIDQ